MIFTVETLRRWRTDPVAFVEEVLVDPETGAPFRLYEEEKVFLRRAFSLTPDGRLPYPELVFSAPKKSGKTALAALATIYVVFVLGGRFAEGYCLANDEEQAKARVFQAIVRILEASPAFTGSFKATQDQVLFPETGATITALASDWAGAAGGNPTIVVFDELWAYTTERSHRLWDEMVPSPARKISVRLTVTYAGIEGESTLLEGLYKRGLAGQEIGTDLREIPGELLFYWTHELRAPWQTKAWAAQTKANSRPNAYLRLVENRWVSGTESFIPGEWWTQAARSMPIARDPSLRVVLGIDAALRNDTAAVVAVTSNEEGQVRIVNHRVFKPRLLKVKTLDLQATLERTVLEFAERFNVTEAYFDPYQFIRSAQELKRSGVKMVEFPQTSDRLTAMTENLFDLFKAGALVAYPDDDLKSAFMNAVIVESSRGIRLAKEKASKKIDLAVATAMAALGAVQGATVGRELVTGFLPTPWEPGSIERAQLLEQIASRRRA